MQRRLVGSCRKPAPRDAERPGPRRSTAWTRALRLGLLVALMVAASARTSSADLARRVVLLDRLDADPLGLELSARVRGELRAAGFEVVVLALPSGAAPARAADVAVRELDPIAVLIARTSVDEATGAPLAEVWFSEPENARPRREYVMLNPADPGAGIAKFAVQIADLVKARLAELSVLGPQAPATPEPLLPLPETEPHGEPGEPALTWNAGLALGALADLAAEDLVLLPLLRAGARLTSPAAPFELEVRVTVGGFSSHVRSSDEPAYAELDQALGTLELTSYFPTGLGLEPVVFAGGGAYTLRARGVAPAGFSTDSERAWSAVATAGVGLAYSPVRWLRWSLEAQVLAALPPTVVRVAGRDHPERGAWMTLLSTGLEARF